VARAIRPGSPRCAALRPFPPAPRSARSPAACPFLLVSHTHLQFNPACDHWLDLAEFQELSNRSDIPSLERAAALYRGPFLDSLSVADSPAFEEWMLLKGEEIQRSILSLLDRLTTLQINRGKPGRRPVGRGGSWS